LCLYIADLSDLVTERLADCTIRFVQGLGKVVVKLTGETAPDLKLLAKTNISLQRQRFGTKCRSQCPVRAQPRPLASGGVCAGIPQFYFLGASCAANMGKALRTKARDNAAAAAQRLVPRASGVLKLKIAKRRLCNALDSL
jgi:hypothetical protein